MVTMLPVLPARIISSAICSAPNRLVTVYPPHFLPKTVSNHQIAALPAASGLRIIQSMTARGNDGSTRGQPIPLTRRQRSVQAYPASVT